MSIGWKDGKFLTDEVSEEAAQEFHKRISAIRVNIVSQCVVVPS
jgi:hypothetical protein